MSALAERLQLPINGVLPVVDRLVDSGFAARGKQRGDRRVVTVNLTTAGADLEREAFRAQRRVVCRTGLMPETLDALRAELHALRTALAAEPTGDPWQPAADRDLAHP